MKHLRLILFISILALSACTKENPVQPQDGGPGILRTDELGNILDGDSTDWCFLDTNSAHSKFYPAYPNPSQGQIRFKFYIPQPDTVSLFFKLGNDTTFLYERRPLAAGTYELNFDGSNYLGLYQRIHFSSKYLVASGICNSFGDVKFENPN